MLIYLQMLETENEKDKFSELYIKYKDLMYVIAFRVLNNQADAEDAVHQSFLKNIDNLDKIGSIESPKTKSFVAVICERTAIDILRKRNKIIEISFDDLSEKVSEDSPLQDQLGEIILHLNPTYREVLFLHYHDGYSEKETAKILGISYSNVRKIIERAKKILKEELEKGE